MIREDPSQGSTTYYFMKLNICQNTFALQSLNLMSNKKDKTNRELSEEKIRARNEAFLKEKQQYKERVHPLVSFLRNQKLKFSHAQVGNERIEYFRLDDYEKIVQANKEHLKSNEKLSELIKRAKEEFIFFRRPDHIKIKYPKALEPVPPDHADRKFASFRFDTTQSKHGFTILIILGILALVLFPIWPYWVKYGIWLVSLVLLIILVGIIVVRLAIYLVIVLFNYHVWIFPNLLSSNGFLDSFIPIVEVSKGDRSWFGIFIRLFAFSSLLLLGLHIYMNPNFMEENKVFIEETITDVHDWGVDKLTNKGNIANMLTNLEVILNETADVAHDQYQHIGQQEFTSNNQETEYPSSSQPSSQF